MGIKYISKDWRLFIDSLNKSLKAVLLYNGNTIGFLPMSYSQKLKENYGNYGIIIKIIKYFVVVKINSHTTGPKVADRGISASRYRG